ncbi:DUF6514 family protein [Tyzzerella sp. OttesenSCG-928-J15]|nr:DUF6514 family protein [Tyzzerella sp. OttesenSCG-928-J15]
MYIRELIRDCEMKMAEKGNFCIKYYLLAKASSCLFSNEAADGLIYGIELTKEIISKGSLTFCEDEKIEGFSYNKEETLKFINKLADMSVTPLSLISLADDYLCEKNFYTSLFEKESSKMVKIMA